MIDGSDAVVEGDDDRRTVDVSVGESVLASPSAA